MRDRRTPGSTGTPGPVTARYDSGMIFAFIEDGRLAVYATAPEAIAQFEGLDVESEVVRFYDATGTYLEPRFTAPGRGAEPLSYQLVPNPRAHVDSFALSLYETHSLEPNQWFGSLEELKSALSAKGVSVQFRGQ